MFSTIIVPYDGSKPADTAIEYASTLAKSTNNKGASRIVLLHVVPRIPSSALFIERPMSTPEGRHVLLSEYIEKLYNEMHARAKEMLERKKKDIEDIVGSGAAVNTIVLLGDSVANKILEAAKAEDANLIVIGNIGLSGISKLKTLGSVSRAISERASCPVLIVH